MMMINFKYFRGYGDRLLGLRTWQWLEPGYVYAPYLPLIVSPGVNLVEYDQTLNMRYGTREINPNYYARIVLDTDVQSISNI